MRVAADQKPPAVGLWGKGILPPCKPNNGWTGKGQTGMLRSLTEVCLCTCTLAHFTLAQVIIVPWSAFVSWKRSTVLQVLHSLFGVRRNM